MFQWAVGINEGFCLMPLCIFASVRNPRLLSLALCSVARTDRTKADFSSSSQPLNINQIISWVDRIIFLKWRSVGRRAAQWGSSLSFSPLGLVSGLVALLYTFKACVLGRLFALWVKRGIRQEVESWDLNPAHMSFQVSDLCCSNSPFCQIQLFVI